MSTCLTSVLVEFSTPVWYYSPIYIEGHNLFLKEYMHLGATLATFGAKKLKIAFHKLLLIGLLEE